VSSYSTGNSAIYWKDYHRSIPSDAIPAGIDGSGTPTYIGQFPVSKLPLDQTADTVLATIGKYERRAYGAYNTSKVLFSTDNVKILCVNGINQDSNRPITFWSNTFISSCNLVQGGSSNISEALYIGRANYKGQNVTGSFSKDEAVLNVAWVTTKFGEEKASVVQFLSFEMLYSCVDGLRSFY